MSRWLPLTIGVVGVLISCVAWRAILTTREEALLEVTSNLASESRAALVRELDGQIRTLEQLRDRWNEFGTRSELEWQTTTDLWIDTIPGLASLVWTDGAPTDSRRALSAGAADPPLVAFARRGDPAEDTRMLSVLDGPELLNGTYAYQVRVPTLGSDASGGTIAARFDVQKVIDHALYAHANDHVIEVYWGDEAVYSRGVAVSDTDHPWWESTEDVSLPLDTVWRLRLRPSTPLAERRLSNLPHYLLAVGLILSVLIAFAAHGIRVILQQSRALEHANDALSIQSRQLESAVAERTESLEAAVSSLKSFNRTVSHDLRSPIGAILNYCSILQEDYSSGELDAEGLRILDRIQRSANRANLLLSDLLELSHAGQVSIEPEPVDMMQLARDAFNQAKAAEHHDGEVVPASLSMDALPSAYGDPTLLATVFDNLMTNALKYSIDQDVRQIHVTGGIDHDELLYEVEDNGCGFDPGNASKLFELFERLHSNDDIEGTGVGLAIVQQIVRRHGGRVWAFGEPGKGARFGFALPSRGRS